MRVKTASGIAIGCLILSALLTVTRDIWTHRLLVMGVFNDMRTLSLVASVLEVLLFHLPLVIFFVVVYRQRANDGPLR